MPGERRPRLSLPTEPLRQSPKLLLAAARHDPHVRESIGQTGLAEKGYFDSSGLTHYELPKHERVYRGVHRPPNRGLGEHGVPEILPRKLRVEPDQGSKARPNMGLLKNLYGDLVGASYGDA